MATTLGDLNTLINDRRRDSGSNSIDMTTVGFRAINSTLDIWNQSHDWEWQIEETIVNFNKGIVYYTIPSNYKGAVDMRYYRGSRKDEFDMVTASNFDSETLKTRRFAVSTDGQTERLRIQADGDTLAINPATSLSNNGTWVGATAISNVATDSYEYFDLTASVSFDYSGTSGTITNSTFTAQNLSKYKSRSSLFWNVFMPSITNWTSMTLKFGSDASNYYTASVTTDYLGNTPTANQWNKFKIQWSSLATVGSPDITAIDYLQLTIAYSVNPSATGFRIENFFVSEDVPILFEYYSTTMAKAASGGAKTQNFSNSANTTDTPLFSGKWDFAKEAFINSALEIVLYITGEYTDYSIVTGRVVQIINDLKKRIPSRKRFPETQIRFDIN